MANHYETPGGLNFDDEDEVLPPIEKFLEEEDEEMLEDNYIEEDI